MIKAIEECIKLNEWRRANGLSKQQMKKIKNVRKDKIKALADALQLTPTYLMDWNEHPEIKRSFDYYMEMQLHLLGYKIIYDEEDAFMLS